MWFPSLLLLLAFTSVIADIEEDIERCVAGVDIEELQSLEEMKSSEEFEIVCPMMLDFFDCIENVIKAEIGLSIDELAELTKHTSVGKAMEMTSNVKNVFVDLCTEGSPLNIAYMADIECLDRIENPLPMCTSKAESAIGASDDFAENAVDVGDGSFQPDRDCMRAAYMSACIASVIHDTCGRRAFETFNTMIKRTTIFKNALCSQQDLNHLKTAFVDGLEMEEKQKDLFRLAFDLKKRRK